MPSNRLVGDPSYFVALAAERCLLSLREAEAWAVVEDASRALALRAGGADDVALELSAAHEAAAHQKMHDLETNELYATLLPLAVTHEQLHGVIVSLFESLA